MIADTFVFTRAGRHPVKLVEYVEEIPLYRYARVNHDPSRVQGALTNYPDAVHVCDFPAGEGVGHSIPILSPVWRKIREINNDAGYAYATTSQAMWINLPGDVPREIDIINEKVHAESIIGGGNLIAYYPETETETHVQLVCMDFLSGYFEGNFYTHPWLYWYPTAINKDGRVFKVTSGIDVFFPLLRYTKLWMNKKFITKLDRKPDTWTIADVLAR